MISQTYLRTPYHTVDACRMCQSLRFLSYLLWKRVTACKQWSYWTRESTVSITLLNICVTNDDRYVPFVVITISPYYWLIIGLLTRVTRRLPLVGQKGLCCSIFRFLCSALYIAVRPFVPFCLMHQLCDKVSLNMFEKSFDGYLILIEIHLKTLILTSEHLILLSHLIKMLFCKTYCCAKMTFLYFCEIVW
jgi:hypothetical protein